MIAEHSIEHSSARGRGGLTAGLLSITLTLHRAAGLLDPWPGYAVSTDELVRMLAEESRGMEQPRAGLDELLERHRRLLAEPMRSLLCGEWCAWEPRASARRPST